MTLASIVLAILLAALGVVLIALSRRDADVVICGAVLEQCSREGTDEDYWWSPQHWHCGGSERFGGVLVECACPCHQAPRPLAPAGPRPVRSEAA